MTPTARFAAAAAVLLSAGTGSAQLPDLNLRALQWLRGRFASPVVCNPGGSAQRTIRRLVIAQGPRHARPPVNRITFSGVEIEGATRCTDDLGAPAPDVRGSLEFTLPGTSRPDMAQSEFQRALRQTGGFDFAIRSGRLRVTDWDEPAIPRVVDFEGGALRAREVRPGSDAARILRDFEGRKLTMELDAPDGERLSFHLVLYDFR